MDFKFSKGADDQIQIDGGAPKKNQSALLVLLLILVGGFSYIYFFTGLINPQPEPPAVPAPAPQAVKKPLPPRDGEPVVKKDVVPAETANAAKAAAAPQPAAASAPAVKKDTPPPKPAAPVAPVAAKPVTPNPPVKGAVAPQNSAAKAPEKKEPVSLKGGEQKKADTKPVAVVPKSKEVGKAAEKKVEDRKQAVSDQKVKKAASAKQASFEGASVKESEKGSWTVQVGSYALEEALATDLVLVRKAGLEANVQSGARKKTPMNRLQSAEFSDREAAMQELAKMKKYTSDAFLVDNAGKFVVYAGSYLLDSRAASEKERLASAGFKLAIKRVDVAIPTKVLNAGTFSSKKSAEEALLKLKNAGLKATLK